MSVVTNIILHIDTGRGSVVNQAMLDEINALKADQAPMTFVEDGHSSYGGSKCLEVSIAIGAFNYLGLSDFILDIKDLHWPVGSRCSLMYCDQEDVVFTLQHLVP